jgi:hypothetical protein
LRLTRLGAGRAGAALRRYLAGKGLRGTIPDDPKLWFDLHSLRKVDFSNNWYLTGTLPAALSSASALESV